MKLVITEKKINNTNTDIIYQNIFMVAWNYGSMCP